MERGFVDHLGTPIGTQPDLVAHVGHVLPPMVEGVHLTNKRGGMMKRSSRRGVELGVRVHVNQREV